MNFAEVKHLSIGNKSLVRLTIDGKVSWKGLPIGYTRLDYIESTGTQYIDTGFYPNQDSRIVCEFKYSAGNGIYGARNTTSSDGFTLRVISSKWQPQYNDTMSSTSNTYDKNWHTADQNKNVFAIDGAVVKTFTYAEFTVPNPVIIGGIFGNKDGVPTLYGGECCYRSTRIYDNDALVRDLVPCRNAAGEIGMYDMLNATFYGNAGSGEFIAGEEQ